MTLSQFEKIYCINLDRRPDRWFESSAEFQKIGVFVERWPAILHPRGALGCSMSHLSLMRKNIHRESILIFEDDVEFRGSMDHVDQAIAEVPDDWELIYFGGVVFPNEFNRMKVTDNVFVAKNVVCTHAYAISNRGMKRVLAEYGRAVRFTTPIDEYYRSTVQPDGRCYCIVPMIATQRAGKSDITGKVGGSNNLLETTNQKFVL